MPHYFFSLKTRNAIPHTERSGDFPDLRAALAEANAAARSMLHTRPHHIPLDVHGSLDVEDERRRPVARIMLADVARQIF
jgi:hypothetical protein